MSDVDKAFMLELTYRLTVALHMAVYKYESMAWMEKWDDHLLSGIAMNNPNDRALEKLAKQMKNDKENGLLLKECGWVPCKKGLWDSGERSALGDARQKLTRLADPLGQLEYIDGRKKDHPHNGHLRIPEAWAAPEAIILISKAIRKKSEVF